MLSTEIVCHLQQAKLYDLLQVGCGADELIDLLMRCCLDPGDSIVDCPPTFTMYAFDAAVNGAEVITIPRLDGFRIDVPGEALHFHGPCIILILGQLCNEHVLMAMPSHCTRDLHSTVRKRLTCNGAGDAHHVTEMAPEEHR